MFKRIAGSSKPPAIGLGEIWRRRIALVPLVIVVTISVIDRLAQRVRLCAGAFLSLLAE